MAVRAPEPYVRILVPVSVDVSPDEAMAVACRLAAERGAVISILAAIEVPPELPLYAQMPSEEDEAQQALVEARAVAELYGVSVSARVVRARAAAEAIVERAVDEGAQLVVLGAPRRRRASGAVPLFGRTVTGVLAQAPCRVMVAAR